MIRFGLIGRTLKHSFSKTYFTKKFAEAGLKDHIYDNFELETIEKFPQLFTLHPDIRGLNVTIPYKEEVLPYLTSMNEIVQEIGACNCIKVEDGKLIGYNTDVVGFTKSLEPKLKPNHRMALVLGTGGAAKAICYALAQLGISYKMVSRQKSVETLGYEDVTQNILATHHLIINTTPLGMYPNMDASPSIPYQFVTPQHFLFDIVYNPEKTQFLRKGEEQGAHICNGYEMLIEQAEESWRIWNHE